jgi:hypothetical protein
MARTFLQAFSIVTMTALNVTMLMAHNYLGVFVTGTLLSGIWWHNSRATRPTGVGHHICYAIGAGFGSMFGLWIGRL